MIFHLASMAEQSIRIINRTCFRKGKGDIGGLGLEANGSEAAPRVLLNEYIYSRG